MKTLLIVFLFFASLVSIKAQNNISYAYDASGNRTERIIILATKSAEAKIETFFTEELAEKTIKIYPNPTEGFLKVEIGNNVGIKNCTITINAMNTGKQVKKVKATFPITDINISDQPFGVYIMLINIDGAYTSWKIMKK